MKRSLASGSALRNRVTQSTSAHSMPAALNANRATGRMQAGCLNTLRNATRSNVGSNDSAQSARKIPSRDVDHGNAVTAAMARPSLMLIQVVRLLPRSSVDRSAGASGV